MSAIFALCAALISLFACSFNSHAARADINKISIALACDDNYSYPAIVTMTSILENRKRNTFCDFYIMVPNDFKNKNNILNLKFLYKNVDITIIDMKDKFKELYIS